MNRAGIKPSQRRGQNFLLDNNQLRFIAETAFLGPDDVTLEVGPGSGFLTRYIAKSGSIVMAVELDRGLLPLAQEETRNLPNVFFMQGDILAGKNAINPDVLQKLDEMMALKRTMLAEEAAKSGEPAREPALKSVSNLPYSAGTPFVMNLLSSALPWKTGVFLLQKEVAERIGAEPGSKAYGALSIGAGLASVTTIERIVPPRCFWPRPNVESAVIKMDFLPMEERLALPWKGIKRIATAAFGSRRKPLRNALTGVYADSSPDEILARCQIDPGCRGETMTPAQFKMLGEIWESEAAKRE